MIWGQSAAAPAMSFGATLLLGALMALVAVRFMPRSRPRTTALVVAGLALFVPLAARATLPFSFTNGTIADATQVNANFAAVSPTTTLIKGPGGLAGTSLAFNGPTVVVTTTNAMPRITGSVTAMFQQPMASPTVNSCLTAVLCYRVNGSSGAPGLFGGAVADYPCTSQVGSFFTQTVTASDTVVAGSGIWQVGLCTVEGNGTNPNVINVVGWVQTGQ
jgi:hypothetical protein